MNGGLIFIAYCATGVIVYMCWKVGIENVMLRLRVKKLEKELKGKDERSNDEG